MAGKRFRSKSDHSLDDKGRLSFPSRFRDVLREYDSDTVMIAPWFNTHLRIYPLEHWEDLEEKLMGISGPDSNYVGKFVRLMLGNAVETTLDKQGRILLNPNLRKIVNLQKEIALIGMIKYVAIWDLAAWDRQIEETLSCSAEIERELEKFGIN